MRGLGSASFCSELTSDTTDPF